MFHTCRSNVSIEDITPIPTKTAVVASKHNSQGAQKAQVLTCRLYMYVHRLTRGPNGN